MLEEVQTYQQQVLLPIVCASLVSSLVWAQVTAVHWQVWAAAPADFEALYYMAHTRRGACLAAI